MKRLSEIVASNSRIAGGVKIKNELSDSILDSRVQILASVDFLVSGKKFDIDWDDFNVSKIPLFKNFSKNWKFFDAGHISKGSLDFEFTGGIRDYIKKGLTPFLPELEGVLNVFVNSQKDSGVDLAIYSITLLYN